MKTVGFIKHISKGPIEVLGLDMARPDKPYLGKILKLHKTSR